MLAKSKLNSTETLVSQALIDMETSHEEFDAILKEKNKYEKENIRNVSAKLEDTNKIMRLNSVNLKSQVDTHRFVWVFTGLCGFLEVFMGIRKFLWVKKLSQKIMTVWLMLYVSGDSTG